MRSESISFMAAEDGPESSQALSHGVLRYLLESSSFWQTQAMVGAVTAAHYVAELAPWMRGEPLGNLPNLAATLYVFPIALASLRFGRWGGVLTGLWCGLLVVPNVVLWHAELVDWLVELAQIAVAMAVGLLLSRRAEREDEERRRSEAVSDRLVVVTSYARQLTSAQERQRWRIARDLHDRVTQRLAAISMNVNVLHAEPESAGPRPASGVERLRTIAVDAMTDVKRITHDLYPTVLDDLGLVPALRSLAADLRERSSLSVTVTCASSPAWLSSEQKLCVFRVVEEALNNVRSHAGASRVQVKLQTGADVLRVTVSDDGIGFRLCPDATVPAHQGSFGLLTMRERAAFASGELRVQSAPGEGTTIALEMSPAQLEAGASHAVDREAHSVRWPRDVRGG